MVLTSRAAGGRGVASETPTSTTMQTRLTSMAPCSQGFSSGWFISGRKCHSLLNIIRGPKTNVVPMQASTPGVFVRFQNTAKRKMPANGIIR